MTDKVQKIREEVERIINRRLNLLYGDYYFDLNKETEGFSNEIMDTIESLQEESATSVWHDANTLPSDPKAVIVEHNEYSTSICRAEQMSRVKGAKWAYINDLLKL